MSEPAFMKFPGEEDVGPGEMSCTRKVPSSVPFAMDRVASGNAENAADGGQVPRRGVRFAGGDVLDDARSGERPVTRPQLDAVVRIFSGK